MATKRPSTASSILEHDIRKFFPPREYSARYPSPDPQDPFAPLWVLRSRQHGSSSQLSSLDGDTPSRPASPVTLAEPTESKPKRSWRKLQNRKSHSHELLQAPDPERKIRRPKSMPHPQRDLSSPAASAQPSPTLTFAETAHTISPSINGYQGLDAYLQSNGHAFPTTESYEIGAVPTRRDSTSGVSSRDARHNLGRTHWEIQLADESPPTPPPGKSFILGRFLKSKKSCTNLSPPVTPTTTCSSPKHPSSPALPEPEGVFSYDLHPFSKQHRPSTAGSATTMSTMDFVCPPPRTSSLPSADVACHPCLADIRRDTIGAPSLQPSRSLFGRRRANTERPAARPRTSPGRPGRPEVFELIPISNVQGRHQHREPPLPAVPDIPFEPDVLPTKAQLLNAASLTVISETGLRVRFGDLWEKQKVIVCFIRHFWCPFCQDYMASISQHAYPAALKNANLALIVISNGSHAMIKSYRQIFRTPFKMYTDPSARLYSALGMTLRTLDPGPESKRGKYVKHGVMSGIARVVMNALKVGMPVWEKGGEVSQLGGEFVLGPGLKCTFAHRMRNTRGHSPITAVLEAGGADVLARVNRESVTVGQRSIYTMSQDQEASWLEGRKRSWSRLQNMKDKRRFGSALKLGEEASVADAEGVLNDAEKDIVQESTQQNVQQDIEHQGTEKHVSQQSLNPEVQEISIVSRDGRPASTLPPPRPPRHPRTREKIWEAAMDHYPLPRQTEHLRSGIEV